MNEQQLSAVKQALEALEFDGFTPEDLTHRSIHTKAIAAIKQALNDATHLAAPAQQESVFSFQMQLKPGWGNQYPKAVAIGQPDIESLFGKIGDVVTFYTAPLAQPAPVPDAIHHTDTSETLEYINGWNDCRAEMLRKEMK